MDLHSPTHRRRLVISLTPLIDVVFILLLFFMLASNFTQERSVYWNSVVSGESESDELPLETSKLHIQTVGVFVLDGNTMPQSAVFDELAARQQANALHSVQVSVSEEIDVQALLSVIAGIKQLGINKVVMTGADRL